MKRIVKVFVLVSLSFLFSILAVFVIAERYFFTIFFESKSSAHGYWPEDKNLSIADFGKRGEDVLYLKRLAQEEDIDATFHTSDSRRKIAFISDSFGWGNGLRFKYAPSEQLEKRLRHLNKNFEVLSLSMGGESLLDHAVKADILNRADNIEYYIFLIVDNDFLLTPSDDFYPSEVYKNIISECEKQFQDKKVIRHPPWNALAEDKKRSAEEAYELSYKSDPNICIFEKSLDLILTKTEGKSIFVISDYQEHKSQVLQLIIDIFNKHKVQYIDSYRGKENPKYRSCWEDEQSLKKCFWVTKNDSHPSPLLNQMYTDLIMDHFRSMNLL